MGSPLAETIQVPGDGEDRYDDQGRLGIGYIDLTVQNDMAEWPSATEDDLVLFEFGTPGSRMSMLFFESESIRRTFTQLLESCRGVYGLLDMEESAVLFWLRGEEMDERLPTADMPLAEIERLVGDTTPIAVSFRADEVTAAARQVGRSAPGVDLGVHHWLVALLEADQALPGPLGRADPAAAATELRRRLDRGEIGALLSEQEVRDEATQLARRAGRDLVTAADVARVIADWAEFVELTPAEPEPAETSRPDESIDYPSPRWWTPRNSTCDPLWRRWLDRVLMLFWGRSRRWVATFVLIMVALGVSIALIVQLLR